MPRYVYKVISINGYSIHVRNPNWRVDYMPGSDKWIKPEQKDTWLFVFNRLQYARNFVKQNKKWLCKDTRIFRCAFRGRHTPSFTQGNCLSERLRGYWDNYDLNSRKRNIGKHGYNDVGIQGTMFVREVRLISEVF